MSKLFGNAIRLVHHVLVSIDLEWDALYTGKFSLIFRIWHYSLRIRSWRRETFYQTTKNFANSGITQEMARWLLHSVLPFGFICNLFNRSLAGILNSLVSIRRNYAQSGQSARSLTATVCTDHFIFKCKHPVRRSCNQFYQYKNQKNQSPDEKGSY